MGFGGVGTGNFWRGGLVGLVSGGFGEEELVRGGLVRRGW